MVTAEGGPPCIGHSAPDQFIRIQSRLERSDALKTLLNIQLKLSKQFASTYDSNGDFILFSFARPEMNYRLPESMRVLLSCFSVDRGVEISHALKTFYHHCQITEHPQNEDASLAEVAHLLKIGALIRDNEQAEESGPYHGEMFSYYSQSRRVPPAVCAKIMEVAGVRPETAVLDIGTGPGSIALQLGRVSANVTGIDISEDFLKIARAAAHAQGSSARFECADANKLVFGKSDYDLITASQVLHWLNSGWAVQGIDRSLRRGGSLFVVESKPVLWTRHPFRRLFNLGNLSNSRVTSDCTRHTKEYLKFFGRLAQPPYPLELAGMWIFRQHRPFDIDFARAYFFPEQIRSALSGHEEPIVKLKEQLDGLPPGRVNGTLHWLLLQFKRRSTPHAKAHPPKVSSNEIIDIPYDVKPTT
jgi:2-polyprenyl-3-methyl-5-hydroxy-6-metoxy-1,4-benzoquinol methylase